MINRPNAIFALTSFITLCACFYQIVFWGFFELNGLEMTSISDILQITIIHLIKTLLNTILIFCALSPLHIWLSRIWDIKCKPAIDRFFNLSIDNENQDVSITDNFNFCTFIFLFLTFTAITLLIFITFFQSSCLFLFPSVVSSVFFLYSVRVSEVLLKDSIVGGTTNKMIISSACVFMFIDSGLSGYTASKDVIENKSFKYTVIVPNHNIQTKTAKNDTIKFLGFKSSGEFVFISKDNREIYFIKSDTIKLESFNE
jgi:hypothetical protein